MGPQGCHVEGCWNHFGINFEAKIVPASMTKFIVFSRVHFVRFWWDSGCIVVPMFDVVRGLQRRIAQNLARLLGIPCRPVRQSPSLALLCPLQQAQWIRATYFGAPLLTVSPRRTLHAKAPPNRRLFSRWLHHRRSLLRSQWNLILRVRMLCLPPLLFPAPLFCRRRHTSRR